MSSGGRTYTKYTASLSRDFYFNVFHKVHLNGAWFGGSDLDRFAKYQFGMFDNTRIHGVPASGVRYSALAMARGSYSFNIFEQYRLDLFVEQAWGLDRPLDPTWQPIFGFGVAVNVRAPKNTILRIDAGKSRLPARYRNVGSCDAAGAPVEAARMTTLRADMHVHTCHSKENRNMPFLRSRDCYSRPEEVYRVAKARGMDLVAITDHDTIDGALELLDRQPGRHGHHRRRGSVVPVAGRRPRRAPGRLRDDRGAARRRAAAAAQRVRRGGAAARGATSFSRSIICSISIDQPTPLDAYLRLLDAVPALEVRNGAMLAEHNRLIERIAARWRPARRGAAGGGGGSDAHTLRRVGTTWTEAPGRDRDEFLRSVRDGRGRPAGATARCSRSPPTPTA